jgi:hypothetical protein
VHHRIYVLVDENYFEAQKYKIYMPLPKAYRLCAIKYYLYPKQNGAG